MKPVLLFILLSVYGCAEPKQEPAAVANADTQYSLNAPEGCGTKEGMASIQAAISMQNVLDMTDSEAHAWLTATEKPSFGLQSYSLDTLFSGHCLLSIKAEYEWMAAYPSSGTTYMNFDEVTGKALEPEDLFDSTKLNQLIALADEQLKEIITDSRKDLKGEELEDFDNILSGEYRRDTFSREDLKRFYINDREIIFDYAFGFPHVALALEPMGKISFSATELQPFIRKDGPLGYWVQ